MPPAARIADPTTHGSPLAPGPGSVNVLIGGMPAWRAMIDQHACPAVSITGPDGVGSVMMGSPTVFINGQMACRMGDIVIEKPGLALGPANPIIMGCPTVMIGEAGSAPGPGAGSMGGGMSALADAMSGETGKTAQALTKAAQSGSSTVVVGGNQTLSQAAGAGSSGASATSSGGSSAASSAGSSASGAAAGSSAYATSSSSSPSPGEEKTWIEIELLDPGGNPVPNEPYRIDLPDGTSREGCTDAQGIARLDGIDPGNCQISFTALDKQAWGKA